MGLLAEIGQILKTGIQQVTSSSRTTTQGITFTKNFHARAKAWNLTEKDAEDAYYHGQKVKPNMIIRKYNGYEIGIYYFFDKQTAQPAITSIWKR